jgi:YggT family protein
VDTLAGLGNGLLSVLILLLQIYGWIVLASALISWILLPPTNPVIRLLRFVTEPVLHPCRQLLNKVLPYSWQRFDFSPVLALLVIQLVISLLRLFAHA